MPELPEVETTRRGIAPHVVNNAVTKIVIRQYQLRWPIPRAIKTQLPGQTIISVDRRAKYLLLKTDSHCIILHLGMSGSLRILNEMSKPEKHDHVDIVFKNGKVLRFRDPRRFGSLFWTKDDPLSHIRLISLGIEPFDKKFTGDFLFEHSRKKTCNVKFFIMNAKILVGVGNIYASESLFAAGISPLRIAGSISKKRYTQLVNSIISILKRAIKSGGTSLKDFKQSDGQLGYFTQQLNVYGKTNEPCPHCQKDIKQVTLNQRSTFYCASCQT